MGQMGKQLIEDGTEPGEVALQDQRRVLAGKRDQRIAGQDAPAFTDKVRERKWSRHHVYGRLHRALPLAQEGTAEAQAIKGSVGRASITVVIGWVGKPGRPEVSFR